MNDVGGESGTGLRAGKVSRTSDTNFEYDDSEWDVGIGNLIIDLDADIEKNNEASRSNSSANNSIINNSASNSNSPVHPNNSPGRSALTPPTSSIPSPMHIPQTSGASGVTSSNNSNNSSSKVKSTNSAFASKTATVAALGTSGELSSSGSMEHSAISDKGLKMKIKRKGKDAKHEIVKDLSTGANSINNSSGLGSVGKSVGQNDAGAASAKSAHGSSSIKDKVDKCKDMMILIEGDSVVGSNSNNGIKDPVSGGDQGKKAPRKGKETKEKKAKNSNGSGSSKKDERSNSTDSKTNAISSHTKDGKEFFNATVSLNVPTIVPNASSAFSKTTLKVPGTNPSSAISSNSQNNIQLHSNTNDSRNHNHSLSGPSVWPTTGSPSKGSNSSTSLSTDKGNGNPTYGKKVKGILNHEDGPLGISPISSYRHSSDSLSTISATVNHQGPPGSSLSTPKGGKPTTDICIGTSVGTVTDPDCLGPCEPGTAVTLEGIVWHENENGILVVNVTWRGKTYVGSLLDCTKNDWAPPRFCDSPTSDLEMRTPKNRAKRGRGQTATPVNEIQSDVRIANVKLRNGAKGRRGSASNTAFVAPASPLKGEQWPKRKTRGSENESQDEPPVGKPPKKIKVSKEERKERQSNSPVATSDFDKSSGPSSPALIECPEPNCSKKYKHINGLRYHQSHAHNNFAEDSDSNASTASNQLATPTDAIDRPGSEPMVIDNICDLDGEPSSLMVLDDSSLSKRNMAPNGALLINSIQMDDLHDENTRLDKDTVESQAAPLSLTGKSASKSGKVTKDSDKETADSSKSFDSLNKETPLPSSIASRAPILTVPSFISLQNRSVAHRTDSLHLSREQDNPLMKPTPMPVGTSPIMQTKGVPWQPHVHNPVSSLLSQQSHTTLNIPHGPGDKLSKDKSSESHGKKNKHKKKSRDKDKDGKSKSDSKSDKANKDSSKNKFSSLSSKESHINPRDPSSVDDLRIPKRDELDFNKEGNVGNIGDARDDPHSPAYSDISDANDSNGDGDLNVGGIVKDGCKSIGSSDLKKDTTPTPYYSPFYSPYIGDKLSDKPVGHSPDNVDKLQGKSMPPHGHLPTGSGPPSNSSISDDTRRSSPKMDFHHPKYLPQQHFFHYPYSNYHFEQGHNSHNQFNNMMPENSFRGGFAGSDEKEKEISVELSGNKNKLSDRDGIHIKQEPGLRDGRSSNLSKSDDKIKSEFGSEPQKSHFMQTCSKHSKDPKRDDMSKDNSRHGLASDKSKDDLDKEKERNEGAKPTMETQGPPPPPTAGSYAYIPQPYLPPGAPYGLHFDPGNPLYRQVLVPGPYGGGSPYMHPGSMPRYPPPPPGGTPLPEDLSRPNPIPSGSAAKALDLLQHHAQYYQVHKIHELQERALKSPGPQAGQRGGEPPIGVSSINTPASPAGLINPSGQSPRNSSSGVSASGPSPNVTKSTDPKDSKQGILGLNESSLSPPTHHVQQHVHSHTHHHTHVGFPIPIMPTFPAPHSPHYGKGGR